MSLVSWPVQVAHAEPQQPERALREPRECVEAAINAEHNSANLQLRQALETRLPLDRLWIATQVRLRVCVIAGN